jgi:TolB-like protein
MAGTQGIFTTRKLQALLDARLSPEVNNRARLAEFMTRHGQTISVHGVDAWFKHTDSNYAIERESLDPEHPSYALPKARWAVLFEIFTVTPEQIEPDDADFRRWCYSEARNRRQPPVLRQGRVACCFHPRDQAYLTDDRAWFANEKIELVELSGPSHHSDWSVMRTLKDVDVIVVYLSPRIEDWSLLAELRDVLQQVQTAAIGVSLDGYVVKEFSFPCYPQTRLDHRPAISSLLKKEVAPGQTAIRSGPAWSPPELYTARPSIAVLPFANFSGNQDYNELAEAIAEDITSMLSRVPELFVVSTSTTRSYRTELPDSRIVRDELGVRYVLEGSIRRGINGGLRVTAQLVDAVQRNGLWSQRYERNTEDLAQVQDELAIAICAQLEPRIRLSDMQLGATLKATPAWRASQEGWYWLFVDAPQPVPERSIKLFRDALAIDPEYPLAHAGMSLAISTALLWGGMQPDQLPVARMHAERALKLLPGNGSVLYALGMLAFVSSESLETVIDYIAAAVEQEPSNAMYHAILGYLFAHVGRTQEGVDRCLYAMRLSPKDSREPFLSYMLGNAYIADRDYQKGIDTFSRCLRFSEVDFIWIMLGYGHCRLNDLNRTRECLRRIEQPRSAGFYTWSLLNRLWLSHSEAEKQPFLDLLGEVLLPAA